MKIDFLKKKNRLIKICHNLNNEIGNSKHLWQISRILVTSIALLLFAKKIYGMNYWRLMNIENYSQFLWAVGTYFGYKTLKNYNNYFHLSLIFLTLIIFYKFIFKAFITIWVKMLNKN